MDDKNKIDEFFKDLENSNKSSSKKNKSTKTKETLPKKKRNINTQSLGPKDGWKTLSSKGKVIIAGGTSVIMVGAGLGAGFLGSSISKNSRPLIKMILIPPTFAEHDEAIRAGVNLENYINNDPFIHPRIQIQVIATGLDINGQIANGSHDMALTTHSSWLQDNEISGNSQEVQFLVQTVRPGIIWDLEDTENPGSPAFGDYTKDILSNDKEEWFDYDFVKGSQQLTKQSNGLDDESEEWIEEGWSETSEEKHTWFRSQLWYSKKGSELWLDENTLSFVGVTPSKSTDLGDVVITNSEELTEYLELVFETAYENVTEEGPQLSIQSLTNLVDARNGTEDHPEKMKYLHSYSSQYSTSNYSGPRSIFKHLFVYGDGSDGGWENRKDGGTITEREFWLPNATDFDGGGRTPYLHKGGGGNGALTNFREGVSLLGAQFSGWRQQPQYTPGDKWIDSYEDGKTLAISPPIYNDGWVIQRSESEATKQMYFDLLEIIVDLPQGENEPGELIGMYAHSEYKIVDDKAWLPQNN